MKISDEKNFANDLLNYNKSKQRLGIRFNSNSQVGKRDVRKRSIYYESNDVKVKLNVLGKTGKSIYEKMEKYVNNFNGKCNKQDDNKTNISSLSPKKPHIGTAPTHLPKKSTIKEFLYFSFFLFTRGFFSYKLFFIY